ncbi:Multiple organellar RNA editing factor 1 [Arachis hypogaea]|uniref:Uncharacterized protein n=1 Tax=Arachis hypogaea TaxID=3818 RepID=A0A444YGN7_ARAHY|nr:Multiple organellar RNA editing factor 1 [Arachis hypogaea]RYR01100.1 hypothetical protein Ahy_B06g079952 [Arachis hypogaea]
MDFPGDNKPSPEEMVSASVWRRQSRKSTPAVPLPTTLAFKLLCLKKNPRNLKVFVVTELPGVISVLPDAYIDPVNKEYGGDKYINGTIIPRPPPIQYGRNTGRRPHQFLIWGSLRCKQEKKNQT